MLGSCLRNNKHSPRKCGRRSSKERKQLTSTGKLFQQKIQVEKGCNPSKKLSILMKPKNKLTSKALVRTNEGSAVEGW